MFYINRNKFEANLDCIASSKTAKLHRRRPFLKQTKEPYINLRLKDWLRAGVVECWPSMLEAYANPRQ